MPRATAYSIALKSKPSLTYATGLVLRPCQRGSFRRKENGPMRISPSYTKLTPLSSLHTL